MDDASGPDICKRDGDSNQPLIRFEVAVEVSSYTKRHGAHWLKRCRTYREPHLSSDAADGKDRIPSKKQRYPDWRISSERLQTLRNGEENIRTFWSAQSSSESRLLTHALTEQETRRLKQPPQETPDSSGIQRTIEFETSQIYVYPSELVSGLTASTEGSAQKFYQNWLAAMKISKEKHKSKL